MQLEQLGLIEPITKDGPGYPVAGHLPWERRCCLSNLKNSARTLALAPTRRAVRIPDVGCGFAFPAVPYISWKPTVFAAAVRIFRYRLAEMQPGQGMLPYPLYEAKPAAEEYRLLIPYAAARRAVAQKGCVIDTQFHPKIRPGGA